MRPLDLRASVSTTHTKGMIAVVLLGILLVFAIVYPMLMVAHEALLGQSAFSGADLADLIGSTEVVTAARNTLVISTLTALLATLVGVTLAWLMARTNMPGKALFDSLNLLPCYLSSVVGALSWQVLAAPRTGLLNQCLAWISGYSGVLNIYSIGGISVVLALFYAPYVYLFTLGSLQNMDPALEEAARASGASVFRTVMNITLPLSAPAIVSGALLVFVTSAGIFGVPLVLGVPGRVNTISTLIFRYMYDYPANYSAAAFLSLGLVLFAGTVSLIRVLALRNRRFTTVAGKSYRPAVIDLRGWRWSAVTVNGMYLACVLVPFAALLTLSFHDTWTGAFDWKRLTLRNYEQVFFVDETSRRGLLNSLIISPIGATLGLGLGALIVSIALRTRLPGRTLLIGLSVLPAALPGVVFGFGVLMASIATPAYGTLWIIMFAYVIHYLPTAVWNVQALLLSVSPELDESARVAGASWWESMRLIVLPLLAPGLVSTWLLLFITFIREVGASIMLYTYGTETISIALLRILEYEPFGAAAALGVVQTVLLAGCVFLIRRLTAARSYRAHRPLLYRT